MLGTYQATNSRGGVQIGISGEGCNGCSILQQVIAVLGNIPFYKGNE